MGRPIKNNADWFSHDADLRNDPKVKALRRKFGITGYAIYCMLIEYLTDADFFQLKTDTVTIELVSGDFGITTKKLLEVIDYAVMIDLFQRVSDVGIRCKTLDNRLSGLLSKRKTERNGVIDVDNTQSKVKNSKVKERENIPLLRDDDFNSSVASILNKPYEKGAERGTQGTGQDVDSLIIHLVKNEKWDRARIIGSAKAMKACYQIQGWPLPTKYTSIVDALTGSDWPARLKDLDPERAAENIEQTKNEHRRKPEPDAIGTSAPGSLG